MLVKQVDFKTRLYSPMERLLALDQIRYRKPISIVKQFFDFYMQLRVQGPVQIIPNYPNGWTAEVLSEDKVWTVRCYRGELLLDKVADLVGYTSNGGYITTFEEDLSNNIYYNQQACKYESMECQPPHCIDFCDAGDIGEFQCRCCPWTVNH